MKRIYRLISLLLAACMLSSLPQPFAVSANENAVIGIQKESTDEIVSRTDRTGINKQALEDALNSLGFALDGEAVAAALGLIPETPTTPDINDTLTFSGGSVTGGIYRVDMGTYDMALIGTRFPFTVGRPGGADAVYAVSIDFTSVAGSVSGIPPMVYGAADGMEEISSVTFLPGEASKTLYLDYPIAYGNWNGSASCYLDFHYAYRTATEQRLVEFAWTSDETVVESPLAAEWASVSLPEMIYIENGRAVVPIRVDFYQPVIVTGGLTLELKKPSETIESLSPAEPAGAVNNSLTFLYTLTEDEIGDIEVWEETGGNKTELLEVLGIFNIQCYDENSTVTDITGPSNINSGMTMLSSNVTLRPRYGSLGFDKANYNGGETVTLTVQVQNSAALAPFGVFTRENVGSWFRITLDGGVSRVSYIDVNMDAGGLITASFPAPLNLGEGAQTFCAEVTEVVEENIWGDYFPVATVIYGAFETFTVGTDISVFVEITDMTILADPPGTHVILLDGKRSLILEAEITPAGATYKGVSWFSDNPSVADVTPLSSSTARVAGLSPGVAVITAVSEEAEIREILGMPPNDGVLIQTYRVTVGKAMPRLISMSETVTGELNLEFDLYDNLDIARPENPDDYDEFFNALEYSYTITDADGAELFVNNNVKPGEPGSYLLPSGHGNAAFRLAVPYEGVLGARQYSGRNPNYGRLTPDGYDMRDVLPAYTVEVTAHFRGYPDSAATYTIYTKIPRIRGELLSGPGFTTEEHITIESGQPLKYQWKAHNLIPGNPDAPYHTPGNMWQRGFNFTCNAYINGRSIQAPGAGTADFRDLFYDEWFDSRYPSVNEDGLCDMIKTIDLSGHTTLDLGESYREITVVFTVGNKSNYGGWDEHQTFVYRATVADPTDSITITAYGSSRTPNQWVNENIYHLQPFHDSTNLIFSRFNQRYGYQPIRDMYGEIYAEFITGQKTLDDVLDYIYSTRPEAFIEIDAGQAQPTHVNGVPVYNGSFYASFPPVHETMPNQSLGYMDFSWPGIAGPSLPLAYLNDMEGICFLDFGKSLSDASGANVPVSVYMLVNKNGVTSRQFLYEARPAGNEGRLVVIPGVHGVDGDFYGFYLEAVYRGETYSALVKEVDDAHYRGINTERVVINRSYTGGFLGDYVSNRITLSPSHDLIVSVLGGKTAADIAAVTLDANGNAVPGSSQKWQGAEKAVNLSYNPLLENPGGKMVIEVVTDLGSRLEVINYDRLMEITRGKTPVYAPHGIIPPDGNMISSAMLEGKDLAMYTGDAFLGKSGYPKLYYTVEDRTLDLMNLKYCWLSLSAGNESKITIFARADDIENPYDMTVHTAYNEDVIITPPVRPEKAEVFSGGELTYDYIWAEFDGGKVFNLPSGTPGRNYGYLYVAGAGRIELGIGAADFELMDKQAEEYLLREATEVEVPAIDISSINLQDSMNEMDDPAYAKKAFDMFRSNYPNDMPFTFLLDEVKPGEFDLYAGMSLKMSNDNIAGDFYNTISENTSVTEFKKLIEACKNGGEDEKFNWSLGADMPFKISNSFMGYVMGKATVDPETNRVYVEFIEGMVVSRLSLGFETEISVAVIGFIGFGFEIEFGASMGMFKPSQVENALADPEFRGFKANTELEIGSAFTIIVSGGVGVDFGIAKFQVGLKGKTTFSYDNKILERPYLAEAYAADRIKEGEKLTTKFRLYVFTKASVLFIGFEVSYLLAKAEKSWLVPNDSSNPYHPDSRGFVTYSTPMSLAGPSPFRSTDYAALNGIPPIRSGLLDTADARYWSGGILYNDPGLWADYNDDRIRATDNSLAYDFPGEGGDYAFDAACSGNKSVAAWEHIKEEVSADEILYMDRDAAIRSLLAKTEVVGAYFDGAAWHTAQLSHNEVMDKSPVTAIGGSGAIAVWMRGLLENDAGLMDLKSDSELVYAKYEEGAGWSEPGVVYAPPLGREIASYHAAMDNGGGSMIAVALRPMVFGDLCDIVYLYISPDGEISSCGGPVTGLNPQVIFTDGKYYTGMYSQAAAMEAENGGEAPMLRDLWFGEIALETLEALTPVDESGDPLPASVYTTPNVPYLYPAGAPAGFVSDFRFFADAERLGVVWPAIHDDAPCLMAAKLYGQDGAFRLTAPLAIDMGAAEDQYIVSYDAKINGAGVSAAAILAGGVGGAILAEQTAVFENTIAVDAYFSRLDLEAFGSLPVDFRVINKGFLPITNVEVSIGGQNAADTPVSILSGNTGYLTAQYVVNANVAASEPFTVTATLLDGSVITESGALGMEMADLELSLRRNPDENTVSLDVRNLSGFPLPAGALVTAGLYWDAAGNGPLPGSVGTLAPDDVENISQGGYYTAEFASPSEPGVYYGVVKAEYATGGDIWDTDPLNNIRILRIEPDFYPVMHIAGLPSETIAGTPLLLTGTFIPDNPTNQAITWSVLDAGSTGADISGNTLNTTAAGTVTVRATIADGDSIGMDYIQDFDIVVSAGQSEFVSVTNITGVPATATAGTPLSLSGTVVPSDATNKEITWNVHDAGSTGATLTGNTLNATAAGIVIVRATITNGVANGTDYTQDFSIAVAAAGTQTYTVTFINGNAVHAVRTVSPPAMFIDSMPQDPIKSGYAFGGWYTETNGGGTRFYATTPVTSDLTVYAHWVYNTPSGGGYIIGGGNSATPNVTVPDTDVTSQEPENPTETFANPFDDVKSADWFYDYVAYVYENGLMVGVSSGPMLFGPNMALTRAMAVTVLWRVAGSPEVDGMYANFEDVTQGSWYETAVGWAAKNGIIYGYGEGIFGPEDYITRQDLVVILNRYAEFAEKDLPETREYSGFNDEADIASYAKEAVERFFRAMIVSGKPGNVYDPEGSATRAEFAAMLKGFLEASS